MEKIMHDGLLNISTGSSRKTKVWKQKQISWSALLQRLSTTKRTNETQAEYFRLGKVRQDEIKDVGGFVGGELKDGRRTALTTINRQIITLDADFAGVGFWDKVALNFDSAICAYSTHKHTPEKPRLRLVIPLDRPVTPDEYQAISRKLAEGFGIDNFDDTTYQPHRLMYFPSTSSDAEFFFEYQDGEWLSADSVLAEYDDWQDQTTWARSSRTTENLHTVMKKAGDPLEKKGIIGAFCRAYTIQEVIATFLPDVYEECGENRYTYRLGTSSGGAIVYEDKWLYSFHATDPCSLQLCNAFDLIRIHKFGVLDEGKNIEDVNKLPSQNEALKFCANDNKTKILLTEENQREVQADFDVEEGEGDNEWRAKLQISEKTGKILPTRQNIRTILENDPRIKNSFGYDLFSQRIAVTRGLFWRKANNSAPYWNDGDDAEIRHYLETYYGIDSKIKIEDEILIIANRNSFHRVREYLESLVWDGEPRLNTFFIDYLGAKDSEYIQTVTRKCLLAAVTRVMRPGVKFDNMLVLIGAQGIGKSELLSRLGKKWFSDSLSDMQGKDAYEALRGYWIIEISELEAMKRSEVSAVKKFLSKKVDSFRESYGRRTKDFPRQCVFFGTTNERTFLKDPTGNRRFYPISVGITEPKKSVFFDENVDADIDQVWAEAMAAYKSGESLWIGRELEKTAKKVQNLHTEETPLRGVIEQYLDTPIPKNWYSLSIQQRVEYIQGNGDFDSADEVETMRRDRVSAIEIWCEVQRGNLQKLNAYETSKIVTVLNTLDDWMPYENNGEELNFGAMYGCQKAYVRKLEGNEDEL
ncbi:MAG: hypothetical protein IJU91_00950 [Selenomonadaceae bacterium]|nr:hypothetical protein [Selenomonadaceae bacterium]